MCLWLRWLYAWVWWEWWEANRSISGRPIACQIIPKTWWTSFHSDVSFRWRDSQLVVTFRLLGILSAVIMINRNCDILTAETNSSKLDFWHPPHLENTVMLSVWTWTDELGLFCGTWVGLTLLVEVPDNLWWDLP